MITLRQIEAFKAVIDAGTVVQAAQVLRRSQPSVSRLLSDLEATIGYPLFDRHKGRLSPRNEAQELCAEIDRCFVGLQQIEELAERIGRSRTTQLRIAILPALSVGPLPVVAARFLDRHPEVFLKLETQPRLQVLDGFEDNRYDVALTTLPFENTDFSTRHLATTEFVCFVPADHPLSALEVITPQDLDGVSCISPSHRTPLRQRLGRVFSDAGVRPDIRIEVADAQSAIGLVEQGVGVCIGWRFLNDYAISRGVRVIDFRPRLSVELGALFPANRPLNGVATEFVDAFAAAAQATQT